MGRWIAEEVAAIAEVRKRAAKELALSPQFPEGKFVLSFIENFLKAV